MVKFLQTTLPTIPIGASNQKNWPNYGSKSKNNFFLESTWGLHDLKVWIPVDVKMNHIQNFHGCNYLKQQNNGSQLPLFVEHVEWKLSSTTLNEKREPKIMLLWVFH